MINSSAITAKTSVEQKQACMEKIINKRNETPDDLFGETNKISQNEVNDIYNVAKELFKGRNEISKNDIDDLMKKPPFINEMPDIDGITKLANKIKDIINKVTQKGDDTIKTPDDNKSVGASQNQLDANGDGMITEHEMLNYGSNLVGYNPWDDNKNNDIEASETSRAFTCDMVDLTAEEAQKYEDAGLQVYNNNGHYSVNRQTEHKYNYDHVDITDKLDKDKDGVVSDQELLQNFMPYYNIEIKNNAYANPYNISTP